MAKYPNDDLFEGTKMSFGEHLEELRVCLFKSVVALIIGFCLGLMLADRVMQFMQSPLTSALENYYITKAVDELKAEYPGHVTPEVENVVRHNRLVFDHLYLEVDEFGRVGSVLAEERLAAAQTASTKSDDHGPETPPAAESPEATPKKAADALPTDAESKEGQAKDGQSKESQPKDGSSAPAAPPTPKLNIVGQSIPAPSSNVIRTRVWKPVKMKVTSLSAQEAFMIWMKAGMISGILIASPLVFWQVWLFVAAGLYPHEKNYVYIYLPFSLLLFLSGAAMAFGFVFEPVLDFLFGFNKSLNIDPDPRISEWLGFVLILPLGFGVSFQLPLVMLFLNRIGLIKLETYVSNWRVAILAIFVISAILTPADPISIFLMAGPLTVLYFLGLGMCRWMPRQKNPFAERYEP